MRYALNTQQLIPGVDQHLATPPKACSDICCGSQQVIAAELNIPVSRVYGVVTL